MTLKARVIPCLDVKDGRVVKGVNFVDLVDAGDPVEAAARLRRGGRRRALLPRHHGRATRTADTIFDVVARTAEQCFMPLTVGGGVRQVADIRKLLLAGADKVSINTAAVERPRFVADAADKFGNQCIVVAIDAKRVSAEGEPGRWEIFTHGGREPTGIDAVDFAAEVVELGAGEILLTSMDRDGTKAGYDIALTRAVADAVQGAGDRLGRRRHARPSRRRHPRRPARRCWPPRSSTSAPTRSARPRRTWPRRGLPMRLDTGATSVLKARP